MPLSGFNQQQLQKALVSAFGDEANLRRMLMWEMSVNLEAIAPPGNLEQRTFEVISWAEREGRVDELLSAALRHAPKNPELVAVAEQMKGWYIAPADRAGTVPYKGLEYYGQGDAALFFGREELSKQLVSHLKTHCFLAVIGASGCGKSSLVLAGVTSELLKGELIEASDKWVVYVVKPTERPLETLAVELLLPDESEEDITRLVKLLHDRGDALHLRALRILKHRNSPHMLLIVDQFEELFTLCKEHSEQQAFIDNLLTAASTNGVTTVVLTLRADFYGRCAEFANLRLALQNWQQYIGPMSTSDLRSAIEKPARLNGWDFENGLVDAILQDVEGESGALPLLSHALLVTWQHRSGRTMTFAGYHAAGCVQGAIAKTADEVYDALDADQKNIVRSIFLRLTALDADMDEGGTRQDTRRRVPLRELLSTTDSDSDVQNILKRLEDKRLVTAERTTKYSSTQDSDKSVYVDVTHEALISRWPQLTTWLNENREWLLVHRRLTEAAEEWERLDRDKGALYRGIRLEQVENLVESHLGDLNVIERTFLTASQNLRDAERQEEIRQRQEEVRHIQERDDLQKREIAQARRARNQARRALLATTIALALAIVVGWFLYIENRDLQGQRLLTQAIDLRNQLDAKGAIAKFVEASKYPDVGIDLTHEISSTLRYVAIQLVRQGEQLAAKGSTNAATESFVEALRLSPPLDTPLYLCISSGKFLMGSSEIDREADVNEKPQHTVIVDDFWIMNTEVTNEQYARCVDAGACVEPSNSNWRQTTLANHPVTDIDWHQAFRYSEWVGGSLPTEAEWEKACRGTDGWIYPWGNDAPTPQLLNYSESKLGVTTIVGSYTMGASPYGVLDMAGNVYEWTASVYRSYPYVDKAQGGSTERPEMYSVRGAGFGSAVNHVRCARRGRQYQVSKNYVTGFRVVFAGSCESASNGENGTYGRSVPTPADTAYNLSWVP